MTEIGVSSENKWYVIQTKPYREEQAATNIRQLGLKVLLPKIKRERLEFGNRRATIKPLFPGYLFARFSLSPHLHSIRYARGVNRVLCAGAVPVAMGEQVIGTIQSRIGKDGFVRIGPRPLNVGDQVVINDGPLRGLVGVFERELSDGERAVILLKTVEYQGRVFVEKLRLRTVNKIH